MKIAVISDIHGNMQALETIMADILSEKAERIFCLGDLALAGPEPQKTVDFIKKMYDKGDIEIIQGNTDAMIVEPEKFIPIVKGKFEVMGNALEFDSNELSKENKEFLASLPVNKEIEIDNIKILLVHGSPRKQDENIFPNLPLEDVEEMIKDTNANLILCGHTHIPCGYQTSTNQTVVNTGSVGRPFMDNPKACYVIIDIVNGELNIQHKMLEYDKEKAAEILQKRDFKGSDVLAQMLIKPNSRHA